MKAPAWWDQDNATARLLAPLGGITAWATARRVARPGWRAPVKVICCGNATVGGAGKTTLALDLGSRLAMHGAQFLTRGYGGRVAGPHLVRVGRDSAAQIGDEALLLAAMAPCWVARDREAGARAAVQDGAGLIILDDGLQNPGLVKDLSLLVIDGASGFGNGRRLPAGPLRETVAAAAARCQAAVLIGEDRHAALAALPPGLPVLRADLVPDAGALALAGQPVFAFSGIARPEKFLGTLRACHAVLAGSRAFADHHVFTAAELDAVLHAATAVGAMPVTTAKDAVRIPLPWRNAVRIVGVGLAWQDVPALAALLDGLWQ